MGQTQRQWLLHSKFGHDLTEENYISFHRTAAVKVPHICVMATSENGWTLQIIAQQVVKFQSQEETNKVVRGRKEWKKIEKQREREGKQWK